MKTQILVLFLALTSIVRAQTSSLENIIIGDSLCTFIDNASLKASRLSPKGNLAGTYLWYGGTTLTWLKQKVNLYPVTPTVKNVIISTGTNSSYSPKDDITGLVFSLRQKFPNANLIVVPGSWWIKQPTRWVVTVSEETVQTYYERFKELGVQVTTPVGDSRICCKNDPHGNFPIYKKIGAEIDALIKP
jgi:hypothetical protein